jgi:formylmethanofuran dehydrogenase subunit B
MEMGHAWIDGSPAALQVAIEEAARLLGMSRLPVIAGLGTDVAGARAAIALAQRLGAVVDHMQSNTLLRDLDVSREAGIMITTPNEARLRADVLLLIGPGLFSAWPELSERLFVRLLPERGEAAERRILWLCPGRDDEKFASDRVNIEPIGRKSAELPLLLAAVRARIAGRATGNVSIPANRLDALATALKAARFGVAVWSAAELDALTIEMLCGMVKDLNAGTRFTGLPLAPSDNAVGVLQTCGWMAGFPMRTGFGRGYPEHDPWRFDAKRLVESGEADCALWVSAYRPAPLNWAAEVPTIVLTGPDVRFRRHPQVHIEVGRPGIDHDAVEFLATTGTFAPLMATHKNEMISVADAISRICSHLSRAGR